MIKKIATNLTFWVLFAITSGILVGHFFPATGVAMQPLGKYFIDVIKLFINPNNFQIHYRIWNNQKRGYYSVPYGPYYIWGATARIMRMFCKILSETNENKQ